MPINPANAAVKRPSPVETIAASAERRSDRGAGMASNCTDWRFWRRTLGTAAVVAILVVAIRLVPDTAPESDHAVIDLSVLNVLHGTQMVGAYSRYGWHHPGPLYFQLLSPLYLLSGYRHLSVTIGA